MLRRGAQVLRPRGTNSRGTNLFAFRAAATATAFSSRQRASRWNWSAGATAGLGVGLLFSAFAGGTALCFPSLTGKAVEPPPFDYKALRADLEALLSDDITVGPLLVRLAWHEAGTWDKTKKDGAPNSASMRFAPECNYGANAGLDKARTLLEPYKKKYAAVSYADLWSLAAIVAIDAMGGPTIPWRWGRVDAKGPEACGPDGRLPDASKTQSHIREVFYRMGFDDREIVALIGAHSVGECHKDRSGYSGPWTHDRYGFGNGFFSELLENDWVLNKEHPQLQFKDSKTGKLMMLPSDVALLLDKNFLKYVKEFAASQDAFHAAFAKAFTKLIELGAQNLHDVPK